MILLFSGLFLLLISLIINFLFIDDDFKYEYRELQYNECIDKNTNIETCELKFKR